MTELGADYSYARPGGAALVSVGVKGVGRYLADDGRGITAGEYADLRNHGLHVWFVREGSGREVLGGYAAGVQQAQIAQQQLVANGLPADAPVYATVDFDISASQFPFADDYLRGFASVLGLARTGIYGGLYYLNHVFDAKLANFYWQAGATSWNHGQAPKMNVNYEQTTNTPPLPGLDHNFIYTTTPSGGGGTPIPEEEKMQKIVHQDRVARDLGPGVGAYLRDSKNATVNIIAGIGTNDNNIISASFRADNFAPGDTAQLRLQRQNGSTQSWGKVVNGEADQDGTIAIELTDSININSGDLWYVYVVANAKNKGTGSLVWLDHVTAAWS